MLFRIMKNTWIILVAFVGIINGHLFAQEGLKPSQIIQKNFVEEYDELLKEADQLQQLLEEGEEEWTAIEEQFFKCRIAYKRSEMFFEYLDREFVKDHINGAPLPKIERKTPDLTVLDPSGFQTCEEALVEEDLDGFKKLSEKLNMRLHEFRATFGRINLTERMVFEAMREEIIRLTALGITGFDTPSGINTMAECETVMGKLKEVSGYYKSYMKADLSAEVDQLFVKGENYFANITFDNFNRFGFITDFVNPSYKLILDIQRSLFVETRDLVFETEFAVNYNAESIFDTDFLNYRYFSAYSNSGNEDERVQLGKILFFDPILSHNNERACASCHDPSKGFADGRAKSLAFDKEGFVDRNSPGLINAVYNSRFFWDARATTPEEQIEHVLFNEKEFNTDYDEMISKLKTSKEYVQRFNQAYPEIKEISRYTIVASIASYIQSLRTFDSDFDKMVKGEEVKDADEIKRGFNVFAGKGACATCHFIPTFAGNVPPLYEETETEVLGVPNVKDQSLAVLDEDKGRYSNGRPKEKAPFYKFSFKTPTIRNVELTAPYMHNGVFNTLEEVVDFYNVGGGHGWEIASENTTLPSDSLNLTVGEINDLIRFMNSLTDTTGMTSMPLYLPEMEDASLNTRPIGGSY